MAMTSFFICFFILILLDIYLVLKFGIEATISVKMLEFSKQHPIFPLGIGIIIGHIFWGN